MIEICKLLGIVSLIVASMIWASVVALLLGDGENPITLWLWNDGKECWPLYNGLIYFPIIRFNTFPYIDLIIAQSSCMLVILLRIIIQIFLSSLNPYGSLTPTSSGLLKKDGILWWMAILCPGLMCVLNILSHGLSEALGILGNRSIRLKRIWLVLKGVSLMTACYEIAKKLLRSSTDCTAWRSPTGSYALGRMN